MNQSVSRVPQVVNVLLAYLLLFLTASVLTMGVFTIPVERESPKLKSVWTSAIGWVNLVSAPAMILTGFLLDQKSIKFSTHSSSQHPLTSRVRYTAFPIAISYLFLLLAIPAINKSSRFLLNLAVLPIGIPWGYTYLVVVELLLSWLPNNPSIAMSVASASFGCSQFIFAPLFSVAIQLYGVRLVLQITSIISFSSVLIILLLVRFPTCADDRRSDGAVLQEIGEEEGLWCHDEGYSIISWKDLIQCSSFYQYMGILFVGRSAFAMLPYFFKLGQIYGASSSTVISAFQMVSIIAIGYSVCSNMMLDILRSRNGENMIQIVFIVVFLIQAFMFFILTPLSNWSGHYLIMLRMTVMAILIILLESQTAFGVLLARRTFGRRNCAMVYGITGGIAICAGESLFTFCIAKCEQMSESLSTLRTFIPYYKVSCGACLLGAFLAGGLRKCPKAFGDST